MEFIEKFVIPQSMEHINLLHYLATLVLFLFVPFISIVFGSTLLSLFFRKKATKQGDKTLLCFSKDLVCIFTVNKGTGIILGIVPVITIFLIYTQLLHTASNLAITYLFVSSLIIIVALIFIYTYRYAMSFNMIFNSLGNFEPEDKSIKDDIEKFSKTTRNLIYKAGYYGTALLIIGVWFFVGGLELALYPEKINTQNVFAILASWEVISRLATFIVTSFALTGGAILFRYLFWEGGIKGITEDYRDLAKAIGIKLAFISSALIPLFLTINLFAFPKIALSSSIFLYSFLGIFVLFICYHLLYAMIKNEKSNYGGVIFILLIAATILLLTKDQLAMDNATSLQSLKLEVKYNAMMASLNPEKAKVPEISGKDVFQTRCSACHSFENRIVGPAFNEALPKYEGIEADLVKFILKPTKINPGFPPMPNPGLKPNEAKAVAKYILATYKK